MADNKMTLLEMTQDILSDMSSDSVNSISDTAEAMQVAQIIQSTYHFLINDMDRPWLGTLFQLEAGSGANPTKMKIPDDISKVLWIKYDVRAASDDPKQYADIVYKSPKEFIDLMYLRNTDADNVTVITDTTNVPLLIYDDKRPSYWTSFDDEYIIFDAYDSDVDSNLQTAKTTCHGYREPVTWSTTDTFVPDVPSKMFPWFLAEAKATCMVRLKQTQDPKAEKQAREGKTRHQYAQWRENGKKSGPNFGRK